MRARGLTPKISFTRLRFPACEINYILLKLPLRFGLVAQLVEHATENRSVGSSILP